MLVDRYPPEDVFARVPELAEQTDPVLVQLDRLLDDDQLYQQVRTDLGRRYRLTLVHGRHSTPAEVLLRLFVVQHLSAWSYQETVERVADSLGWRWFCRVSIRRVPDKATVLRWAQTIRPETLHARNDRVAPLARQAKVTRARRLRIDSTCVQAPIHHPTDSGLVGDGVRVLARLIQRAKPLVHEPLAGVRDALRRRVRSARRVLQPIHRVRRRQGEDAAEAQRGRYARLLEITRQTVSQAERVRAALHRRARPVAPTAPTAPERLAQRLRAQLERLLPLVERGMQQAPARVLDGRPVPSVQKVLRLFEPDTRVVKRQKAGATVEFGRPVVLDEVEGGLVTRYHVLADGESERHQALPAAAHHRAVFGRAPWLVAGDRGLHAKGVEEQAHAVGVPQVAIPRAGPPSPAIQARERSRGWKTALSVASRHRGPDP